MLMSREGLSDSAQHGRDFRGVYKDLLDFLPEEENREEYQWRVTNNVITTHTLSTGRAWMNELTLGAFVKGLYPGIKEYSALVQPDSYDSLEPGFSKYSEGSLTDRQDALKLDRYRTRTRGKGHYGQPFWIGREV